MSNLQKYTNLHLAVQSLNDDISEENLNDNTKVVLVGAAGAMGLGIALMSAVEDGLTPVQEAAALDAMAGLAAPLKSAIDSMASYGISFDETASKVEMATFANAIGEIPAYATDVAVATAVGSIELVTEEPAKEG